MGRHRARTRRHPVAVEAVRLARANEHLVSRIAGPALHRARLHARTRRVAAVGAAALATAPCAPVVPRTRVRARPRSLSRLAARGARFLVGFGRAGHAALGLAGPRVPRAGREARTLLRAAAAAAAAVLRGAGLAHALVRARAVVDPAVALAALALRAAAPARNRLGLTRRAARGRRIARGPRAHRARFSARAALVRASPRVGRADARIARRAIRRVGRAVEIGVDDGRIDGRVARRAGVRVRAPTSTVAAHPVARALVVRRAREATFRCRERA
jgi:hypothetical protein